MRACVPGAAGKNEWDRKRKRPAISRRPIDIPLSDFLVQQTVLCKRDVPVGRDDHVVKDADIEQGTNSNDCDVTIRSSADGVGSPLGWLCTRMIDAAFK